MAEDQVGVVINYYTKPGVAAIKVTGDRIQKGDLLTYRGYTTDFTETVDSLQKDNEVIEEAKVGDLVGIQVKERVRENDKIFKVVD